MFDFSPALIFGLIAAIATIVYLIALRATSGLSTVPRILARIVAAAVVLAPLVAAILDPQLLSNPKLAASRQKLERDKMSAGAPRPQSVAPPEQPRSPPSEGAEAGRRMRSASPAPGAQPKWDVVPVFYGTDRRAEDTPQRIAYGSERGKKLELGRALVTVPKLHQVPMIERPWVYKLPFTNIVLIQEREDPEKHFTLSELRRLSPDDFAALVRTRLAASARYKNHALIFVHGFNTTFDFALYRAAQFAYDLKFDGAPFVYSWPSRGSVSATAYSYDRESAQQAEPYLKQFIELVTARTGATSVSLVAHSMGNQLLLRVLRDINRAPPAGVKISQVILAAPDVDRDGFEFLAQQIKGVSSGITLYAAANDRALTLSREFWGGVPRAGDVPSTGPVVVAGVDTIDVTATSTEIFSLNHSGYAEKSALLNDIELLLRTGERPPEKRIPILERIKTNRGDYWRYPG